MQPAVIGPLDQEQLGEGLRLLGVEDAERVSARGVVQQVGIAGERDRLAVVGLERLGDLAAASLTKSRTKVPSLSGWVRFSRDSVCTAARPVSVLSTYIAYSLGWSNPVWNFSATTRSR